MRMIVVSDRADRETARAIAKRSDHAQQPLPEPEQLPVSEQFSLFFSRLLDEVPPELEDRCKPEFLRFGRAGALVDPEMADRIRRTGIETAAAGFPDTDLLSNPLIRLDRRFGEDAGQINARAEFGRQNIDLEPERAQARLDTEMART